MPRRTVLLLVVVFLLAGAVVYGRSLGNDFMDFDDDILVYRNPVVHQLNAHTVARVFRMFDPELYIPLTFLTFQVEYALVGANPGLFHLTNLLLHIGNALLVCALGYALTRRRGIGVVAGFLFLLHPLHTEAVAWIAGRKDVLSGFFALLSLVLYLQYLRKESEETRETNEPLFEGVLQRFLWTPWFPRNHRTPPAVWFIASGVAFLLALLAKVSVLMLPFLLILMDLWERRRLTPRVMAEKIPFFLLSFVFGLVALGGKGTATLPSHLSLFQWSLLVPRSMVFYLEKLLVPRDLSVLYIVQDAPSLADPAYPLALLTMILLVAVAALAWRRARFLSFAVAAYVLLLVPSVFNLQKGATLYLASDRYAYLASVTIFLLVGAAVLWLWERGPALGAVVRPLTAVIGATVLVILGTLAFRQSLLWHDGERLFTHVLELYPYSPLARNNRAVVAETKGHYALAIGDYRTAIAFEPRNPVLHLNLGRAYAASGDIRSAYDEYYSALSLGKNSAEVHYRIAQFFLARGLYRQAKEAMRNAMLLDPSYVQREASDALRQAGIDPQAL